MLKKAFYAIAAVVCAAPAYALDLTGIDVDVTSVEAMALIVIGGLATLWGLRKLVKLVNRS